MALIKSCLASGASEITELTYVGYHDYDPQETHNITVEEGALYAIGVNWPTTERGDHLVVVSGGTLIKANSSNYSGDTVGVYLVRATSTTLVLKADTTAGVGKTYTWTAKIS